jgi:hypothetical protein
MSFAVENISPSSQAISVSPSVNGLPVASFTTPVLPPNAVYANTFMGAFDESTFPTCVNYAVGACWNIANPDGLWRGSVAFQGLGGGSIIPLTLRAIGNSISSMSSWPMTSSGVAAVN